MRLLFYDHTAANGKAFACVDVLRAHTTRRECQSNFMLFVEGFSLSSEEKLGSKVVGFTARSRPHMQIVCIPMTQKTGSDNGSGRP